MKYIEYSTSLTSFSSVYLLKTTGTSLCASQAVGSSIHKYNVKKIVPAYLTNWSNLETNHTTPPPFGLLGRDPGPANNKDENLYHTEINLQIEWKNRG